jgi:hypothetical protein
LRELVFLLDSAPLNRNLVLGPPKDRNVDADQTKETILFYYVESMGPV